MSLGFVVSLPSLLLFYVSPLYFSAMRDCHACFEGGQSARIATW